MDRNDSIRGQHRHGQVALLTEGVDRNTIEQLWTSILGVVALLAEGVDRNEARKAAAEYDDVALLAEGVDRNDLRCTVACRLPVALLAEGVDRNLYCSAGLHLGEKSPSSRRAWIESLLSLWIFSRPGSRLPHGGRG